MSGETRTTMAQQLAERLQRHIEEAKLEDGELFMTEAEVAEHFDASRTVAREAVAKLRAIGLLEGRQRKGLIVRRPDPVQLFSASLPALARSKQDIAELARLRYVLEVGAIELAVENATAEQIAQLMSISTQMKAVVSSLTRDQNTEHVAYEQDMELDIAYHSLLLEMTGSNMIAGMQRVLVDFFRNVTVPRPIDPSEGDRIAWEHTQLAVAVRERDVEMARALIRAHFRPYLKKKLADSEDDA